MRDRYKAVVIGGGITGCAVVYHLAAKGWTDCALVERRELTSGSTWHAAGGNNQLHDITNMALLQAYTINSFEMIEAETGQSCGIHRTGGLYIAQTDDRVDQLAIMASKAKYLGVTFNQISLQRASQLNPLLDLSGAKAVYFTPAENHVDPYGAAVAFAAGARQRGADVIRHNPVTGLRRRDSLWEITTEAGVTRAEHVVNAAGLWGREMAAMAGLRLPALTMEHQYLVTDTITEVAELENEIPTLHDNDHEYYMRQEGESLLFGAYEPDGRHWALDGAPADFDTELLEPDLDRIEKNYTAAATRVPVLGDAGIRRVVNGPMIWSADMQPLIGPAIEVDGYWFAAGIMAGFSQSAGVALMLAEWMVDGQPSLDVFSLDIARFGPWANHQYVLERTAENYSSRYRIYFPYEERTGGRDRRVRPVTGTQRRQGAVMGAVSGWETPKYFARTIEDTEPVYSFRRANWFDTVGTECRATRRAAGLVDTSTYAKYRVQGSGAARWLNRLLTNPVPETAGRVRLCPMCDHRGRIQGDFTVTKLAEDDFLLVGSGLAEQHHLRWFRQQGSGSAVSLTNLTSDWAGFGVTGPASRVVLQAAATTSDVSPDVFGFFTSRRLCVGGVECVALRVSFTGELGFELYCAAENQAALYETFLDAGDAHGLALVGGLAAHSLRLEKGYPTWSLELTSDYTPYEAGLGHFVDLDGWDFVGRGALSKLAGRPAKRLSLFEIDAVDADAFGGEPIMLGSEVVGEVTSGGYGHTVDKSLALGYVEAERSASAAYTIDVVGEPRPARLLTEAPWDPQGRRLRA